MRLPPPLRVALGPSPTARFFVVALALSTLAVVIALPMPWWTVASGGAALATWASLQWRAFGPSPGASKTVEIALTANRLVVVRAADGSLRAGFVRDLTYVSSSVTAIVWKPDGAARSHAILVLPDMLPADDFRQLRALLRYGRSEEVAGSPASHA